MAMQQLSQSILQENYSAHLREMGYNLGPEHTGRMFTTAFVGVAEALSKIRSMDAPVAFKFNKLNGTSAAVAILQYFKNDNPSLPGNWSLTWSFDETDIPEGSKVISTSDPATYSYFRSAALSQNKMMFQNDSVMVDLLVAAFEQLYKWLDENATPGEEVGIIQDNTFQARVIVDENGEKVFSLEPIGEIKMLIKDDAAIER